MAKLPNRDLIEVAKSNIVQENKSMFGRSGTNTDIWVNPDDTTEYSYKPVEGWIKQSVNSSTIFQAGAYGPRKDEALGLARERLSGTTSKRVQDFGDKLRKDPIMKQMVSQGVSFANVQNMIGLAKGDPERGVPANTVSSAALGAEMAKALEGASKLTDQDVTRYVRSGKFTQGAIDKYKVWATGAPSDATLDEIQQVANVIQARIADVSQSVANDYVERLAKTEGISIDEAAQNLGVNYDSSVPKRPYFTFFTKKKEESEKPREEEITFGPVKRGRIIP